MSIFLAYRAESVGPICRKLAAVQDELKVIHEDQLVQRDLISPRLVQQPAPPDPLLGLWGNSVDLARAFVQIEPGRSQISQDALDGFISKLKLTRASMNQPAPVAPPPQKVEPKVLIRWGSRWEGNADITINSVGAVRLARDKRESRQVLGTLAPTTWVRRQDVRTPCVIRPRRHHAGSRFFVCKTAAEIERAITRCGPGWYASELINKAREFRVFVLQGRVIRISEKFAGNPADVAWNVAVGGHTKGVTKRHWPIEVAKAALKAARVMSLDWTAVDLSIDTAGKVWVFEANTAPGLTGRFAIEQIAWAFASVPKNPTLPALDLTREMTWKDMIHPSLIDRAENEAQ